jgi:hypothetical protein
VVNPANTTRTVTMESGMSRRTRPL